MFVCYGRLSHRSVKADLQSLTSCLCPPGPSTCWGRTPGWSAGRRPQSAPALTACQINAGAWRMRRPSCPSTAAGCRAALVLSLCRRIQCKYSQSVQKPFRDTLRPCYLWRSNQQLLKQPFIHLDDKETAKRENKWINTSMCLLDVFFPPSEGLASLPVHENNDLPDASLLKLL